MVWQYKHLNTYITTMLDISIYFAYVLYLLKTVSGAVNNILPYDLSYLYMEPTLAMLLEPSKVHPSVGLHKDISQWWTVTLSLNLLLLYLSIYILCYVKVSLLDIWKWNTVFKSWQQNIFFCQGTLNCLKVYNFKFVFDMYLMNPKVSPKLQVAL